jgi:hypothetical protein
MKWVLLIGCFVGLLVLLVLVVGTLLPQSHLATRQAHFKAAPETLFATLTDFASAPSWRNDVSKVELLVPRDGKTTFREWGKNGPLVFVVEESLRPTRLVTRIADQSTFDGTWTYELSPENGGTQLTLTERGEIYNPLFRFLSHFFFSQTRTLETYLLNLGRRFGEKT